MKWYADNSELNGVRGSEIPDMLFFGGYSISQEMESKLINIINTAKSRYMPIHEPIKWNFKDLKSYYEKKDEKVIFENALAASKKWKLEIFEKAKEVDFTIIIALIQSHSAKKDSITSVKPDIARYVFSNALMRVALHAKETEHDKYEVVLDWPDSGNSTIFDTEYASAYLLGKTSEGNESYLSGALKELNFADSPFYARMAQNTMLQFADLVLGACREFTECAIGKKETGFGFDLTKCIASHYRRRNGRIPQYGISIASADSEFKGKITKFINENLTY
ncbi:MAG: hypothetical protein IPL32_17905 [Chloracidobacterium sp.]|nr:hypothetical protein [Chloracidobacterium sp.]